MFSGKNNMPENNQIIIPTLAEQLELAKPYYIENIFDKLDEKATLNDAIEKMYNQGNAAWFGKWTNFYRQDLKMDRFVALPSRDPIHSSWHLKLGSPQTDLGEVTNLTAEKISQYSALMPGLDKEIMLTCITTSLKDAIGFQASPSLEMEKFKTVNYKPSFLLNSEENIQVCRVTFNVLFAMQDLKNKIGKQPHEFSDEEYLALPALHFRPHDIMFYEKLEFLNFDKEKGILPKENLPYPTSDINLISRCCVMVNKLSKDEIIDLTP